jgi:hypothetical protein
MEPCTCDGLLASYECTHPATRKLVFQMLREFGKGTRPHTSVMEQVQALAWMPVHMVPRAVRDLLDKMAAHLYTNAADGGRNVNSERSLMQWLDKQIWKQCLPLPTMRDS